MPDLQPAKSLVTKTEIKNFTKDHLIQNGHAESLKDFNNKMIHDATIWSDGYQKATSEWIEVGEDPDIDYKGAILNATAEYVVSRICE